MVHIHNPSGHLSSPDHIWNNWNNYLANYTPAQALGQLSEARKRSIAHYLDGNETDTYEHHSRNVRRRRVTVFTKTRKDSRGKPTVRKGDTVVSKKRVLVPAVPARLNAVEEPMFVIDTKPAQTTVESWREREERLLRETLAARQGLSGSHNQHANLELPTTQARVTSMDPDDVIYFDSGAAETALARPTVRSEPTLSEIRAGLRAAKMLAQSAIRGGSPSPSPKPEYSSSPRLGEIPGLDHDTVDNTFDLQSPETSEFEFDDGMHSDSASEDEGAEEEASADEADAESGDEDIATLRETVNAARHVIACHREYIRLLESRILHCDPEYPFGFPLGDSEPASKHQVREVRRILNNAYPLPPLQSPSAAPR